MEAKGGIKNPSFKVLADSLAIQNIHAQYGGVFPMMAKREHIKNLPILLEQVLKKTGLYKKVPTESRGSTTAKVVGKKPVDAIAVTYGPGLEPCLWTGIVLAQELSKKWNVPVIPVNHMEGHILSVFAKKKGTFIIPKTKSPLLALLVSGGHTELVLVKDWGKYEILGKTVDDAAGEAFDKVARMLGLPYPGGPHISKLAEKLRVKKHQSKIKFPRPMMYSKNLNFSFSGLKTSVLYFIQKNKSFDKARIALEFENAVVETLVYKTKKAIEKYDVKTLIVAGGVAANKHLGKEMKKTVGRNIEIFFSTKGLSRDNSIMIGIAGYLNYVKKKKKTSKPSSIKATGDLSL
jgi:N6-L-threonylcarbamoyladenine synthase